MTSTKFVYKVCGIIKEAAFWAIYIFNGNYHSIGTMGERFINGLIRPRIKWQEDLGRSIENILNQIG